MDSASRSYIPAAGQHWLLPFYDPFLWLLGGNAIRRPLIEHAALEPGFRVLDIGCGTGSLAVLIKQTHPGVEVVGLDPDAKALAIGKGKAQHAGLAIDFAQGFSDHVDSADASFDRVFSTFMFHHLAADEKSATLREVRRVLKRGGSMHLLDFVPARSFLARTVGHLFHRAGHVEHNIEGRVTSLMAEAGFKDAAEVADGSTLLGSIAYYRASKPGA